MYKVWQKIQDYLNIKGGAALGLWTFMMLALCPYAIITQYDFPQSIVNAYGLVIAAFATKKVADVTCDAIKKIKGKK